MIMNNFTDHKRELTFRRILALSYKEIYWTTVERCRQGRSYPTLRRVVTAAAGRVVTNSLNVRQLVTARRPSAA
jgi:hypothetical protein